MNSIKLTSGRRHISLALLFLTFLSISLSCKKEQPAIRKTFSYESPNSANVKTSAGTKGKISMMEDCYYYLGRMSLYISGEQANIDAASADFNRQFHTYDGRRFNTREELEREIDLLKLFIPDLMWSYNVMIDIADESQAIKIYCSPPGSGGGMYTPWTGKLRVDTLTRKCIEPLAGKIGAIANLETEYQKIFANATDFNTVGGMITRIANSADWNVTIDEMTIPDTVDPVTGDTGRVNAHTYGSKGSIRISFNKNYLNEATDLAIARTMIHELMHAYFTYGLFNITDPGYAQFVKANDLLFKEGGDPADDQNDAQHEQIATKYVEGLARMLELYASTNGITSPDSSLTLAEYCKDLAWGGLSATKAYRLYAPSKSRIQANLLKEQTNSSSSTKKKSC
uniref:hypothetical protein n=1 Tax=Pedobacter schmidteae TaxID=2201271 RepID=UPI0013CE6618|nr:hypothetical protein [Pedobacter schmidteae]